MADATLYIGNRNYSSWSLRAWLVVRQAGLDADEVVVPLGQPTTRQEILAHSPSGKVPCLVHGDLAIGDSLAIAEYCADLAPAAGLWPANETARALARAVSAEMHAGFRNLRQHLPMNIRQHQPGRPINAATQAEINRVTASWRSCRRRFAGHKPFLFGDFCIADAMYAPVVFRFRTYEPLIDDEARDYMAAMLAQPPMQAWQAAAEAEPWVHPEIG